MARLHPLDRSRRHRCCPLIARRLSVQGVVGGRGCHQGWGHNRWSRWLCRCPVIARPRFRGGVEGDRRCLPGRRHSRRSPRCRCCPNLARRISSLRVVVVGRRLPTRQRAQPNNERKGKLAIHRRDSEALICVLFVDGVSRNGTTAPTGQEASSSMLPAHCQTPFRSRSRRRPRLPSGMGSQPVVAMALQVPDDCPTPFPWRS